MNLLNKKISAALIKSLLILSFSICSAYLSAQPQGGPPPGGPNGGPPPGGPNGGPPPGGMDMANIPPECIPSGGFPEEEPSEAEKQAILATLPPHCAEMLNEMDD